MGGFFKRSTCLTLCPSRWVLIWRGVWCFLWGGCLFAQLLVELGQCVKIGSCRFFSRKIENQIWHFDRAFEHNLPSPPQGGGGEGGNKQAYLLKFKCRGDVESLI